MRAVFPVRSKRKSVGTARMSPKDRAAGASAMAMRRSGSAAAVARTWSSGDSTASARTAMRSPCWRCNVESHSSVERQGGHHVAQIHRKHEHAATAWVTRRNDLQSLAVRDTTYDAGPDLSIGF